MLTGISKAVKCTSWGAYTLYFSRKRKSDVLSFMLKPTFHVKNMLQFSQN